MIDKIVFKSKNEVWVLYWHKPAVCVRTTNGTAWFYAVELLELDRDICTTSYAA